MESLESQIRKLIEEAEELRRDGRVWAASNVENEINGLLGNQRRAGE